MNDEIFAATHGDMSLAEVSSFAAARMDELGWINPMISVTDGSEGNIGHTIPGLSTGWAPDELATIRHMGVDPAATDDGRNLIRAGRRYVRAGEEGRARDLGGFTAEPRPETPGGLAASFHTTCTIAPNGDKRHHVGYEGLFEIASMGSMAVAAYDEARCEAVDPMG